MSEKFVAHVGKIAPGSAEHSAVKDAAATPDGLLAYSQANGLDLTREAAEQIAGAGPVDDGALDGVSGGLRGVLDFLKVPGNSNDGVADNFLKGR